MRLESRTIVLGYTAVPVRTGTTGPRNKPPQRCIIMVAPQAAQAAAPAAPAAHRARRVTQVDEVPETKIALVKFCLDGFTWQRFLHLESHFQMGYAFVKVKGVLQEDCNSRDAFHNIAKAVATEEIAIPHVLGVVNEDLSKLEVYQLPDSSILLKLGRPTTSGVEYLRPCFVMDHKAFSLWLGRGGANCTHFCAYNMNCTLQQQCKASPTLEKKHATTTFGDLRRLAATTALGSVDEFRRRECLAHRGMQGTGARRNQLRIDGVVYYHNILEKDYKDACKWQKGLDLLDFIPDSVRLVTITSIEPLHCVIQLVNHRVEFIFKVANEFQTQHGNPLLVARRDGKGTRIDGNRLLAARYKRPMMGYAGQDIWKMLREREIWLKQLLQIQVDGELISHAKLDALIRQLDLLEQRLKAVFEKQPEPDVIRTFAEDALALGKHLVDNFPEYKFAPYDHWLVEHMWEFMEYWGGVGKLSSIVCEAANALWKEIEDNHVAGNVVGAAREMQAFCAYAVHTNPVVRDAGRGRNVRRRV